jgi:NADH:ubiquinone oxidoreductase subunit K
MTIFHKITKSEKLVILLIIPTYAKVSSQNVINQLSFEFMLNALRLKAGFESDLFTQRTGQSMPAIQQQLNKAQRHFFTNLTIL